MSQSPDLYERLQLAPSASADEVRKSYRRLALKHHPDKGGKPETFKSISEAYAVLSDTERRRMYDATGEAELANLDELFGGLGDFFAAMMEESGLAEEWGEGDGGGMEGLQASFESFFKASMGLSDGPVLMPDGSTISAAEVPSMREMGAAAVGGGESDGSDGLGLEGEEDLEVLEAMLAEMMLGGGSLGGGAGERMDEALLRSLERELGARPARGGGAAAGGGSRTGRHKRGGGPRATAARRTARGPKKSAAGRAGGGGGRAGGGGGGGEAGGQVAEAEAGAASASQGAGEGEGRTREAGRAPSGARPRPFLAAAGGAAGDAVGGTAQSPERQWFAAAKQGDVQRLERLLAEDPSLLARQARGIGHTALHWSAAAGDEAAVAWLLGAGAAVNARNAGESTPLHSAAGSGHAEVAAALLRAGADPAAVDDSGVSAASLAASRGHEQVAAALEAAARAGA